MGDLDRDDLIWQAERLVAIEAFDDAIRLFDLVSTLWPEAGSIALLGRGACLQLRGSLDEAEQAYLRVLEIEPNNVYARANRAEIRLLRGDNQAARDDLTWARAAIDRRKAPTPIRRRVEALCRHAEADSSVSKP
jgi:Flp pilus assembly protein TadD